MAETRPQLQFVNTEPQGEKHTFADEAAQRIAQLCSMTLLSRDLLVLPSGRRLIVRELTRLFVSQ